MKREMNKNGWKEITTKHINILKPIPTKIFLTAGEWVEFTTKKPAFDKNGRNHCQCCGIKWTQLKETEATYLLFTDKENKIVCQKCYDLLTPSTGNKVLKE